MPLSTTAYLPSSPLGFVVAQISELSDLVDRPLVAALTSRLQALHAHLQAFVEQVDSLVKAPVGRKDAVEEGACPPASNGSPLPCSGDSQDGVDSAEKKVNTFFLFCYFISLYFLKILFLLLFLSKSSAFDHVLAEQHD